MIKNGGPAPKPVRFWAYMWAADEETSEDHWHQRVPDGARGVSSTAHDATQTPPDLDGPGAFVFHFPLDFFPGTPLRALVKTGPGPGMVLREVPKPTCGPSDVLIRVRHAGVCGTDLHIWEWDSWASQRLKPPVVVGHEFAGEIVELGREAEAAGLLDVGDLVTAEGHIVCGHCLQCRLGDAHLCQRTQIIGVDRDGAFADYIAMPASNVMKLDGIPDRDRRHHGSDGQRGAHGARGPGARQHGAGARLRPDRLLRRGRGPRGRRLARHRQRLQRPPAGAGPRHGRPGDARSGQGRRAGPDAGADRRGRRGSGLRDERPSRRATRRPSRPRASAAGSTSWAPRAGRPTPTSPGT